MGCMIPCCKVSPPFGDVMENCEEGIGVGVGEGIGVGVGEGIGVGVSV